MEYAKGDETLKKLGAKKTPGLYVIDPTAEAPLAKAFQKLGKVKSPAKFKKELEKALKKWKKAQTKKETAAK